MPQDRTVNIEVERPVDPTGALRIVVDPYILDLAKGEDGGREQKGRRHIFFKLVGRTYRFVGNPAKAIEIKGNTGQFSPPAFEPSGNRKVIKVTDKADDGKEYKYTIRLEADGDEHVVIDPLIRNP